MRLARAHTHHRHVPPGHEADCLKDSASLTTVAVCILGLAAARLGAARFSPWIMTLKPSASLYNAARNQVCEATFSAVLPDDASLRGALASADWVVANILAGPLIDLAPNLMLLMAPGGRLLLAGLLSDQVEAVVAAYAPTVKLEVVDQVEDWVLLAGRRSE